MFSKFFYWLKRADWILYVATVLLVCFGLAVLYSIAANQETVDLSRFFRQIIFAGAGLILMFIFNAVDYRFLNGYRYILLITGVVLLLVVLVFGQTIRGSTRWLSFFGQTVQPVEIIKLFLIVYLAGYLARNARHFFEFKHIIISGATIFLIAILVALEPKVGYAIIFVLWWLVLLLVVKARIRHLLLIFLFLAVIGCLAWFFVLQDYQKDRVLTFLDPSRDPLGKGYNVTQSIIAVGSGQILGRGLGLGPQSQLNFLPEQETDFIFAVIAEETGIIGVTLIIILFAIILYRIWHTSQLVRDNFAQFLVVGSLILLALQVFINIGMNVGLLPVTGIPLPFLSAGGSSLIVNLITVGIIQSVIARSRG